MTQPDVVERLRSDAPEPGWELEWALRCEAAAEIERLRAALDRAADVLEFYDNKAEAIKARRALEPKP